MIVWPGVHMGEETHQRLMQLDFRRRPSISCDVRTLWGEQYFSVGQACLHMLLLRPTSLYLSPAPSPRFLPTLSPHEPEIRDVSCGL